MLELIVLVALCFLTALGCFGFAGWIIFSPETFDVDVLFSIMTCLLLGTIFLGLSVWIALHSQLRELWAPEPAATASKQQQALPKEQEAARQAAQKSSS